MVISTLNKKLVRDILHLKAQVASIAVVVGIGIAVFFGFSSTHFALSQSRDLFYEKAQFADYFASAKKAPNFVAKEIQRIPGVREVEPRLIYQALLSVPSFPTPAVGQFISIPDGRQPNLNKLYLIKGRLPSSLSNEEAVISEGFFKAHNFELGDHFFATLNGKKRKIVIVGVGVSPEHIIALQSASPFPDDLHFTVAWVNQSLLEATYDMRSSFNNLAIKGDGSIRKEILLEAIDEQLEKYGGIEAVGRDKQVSAVYVNEELKQLDVQATTIPIIFFLVAAFILNVVITRLVQAQRSQVATLKAMGYSNLKIVIFYLKIALVIVLIGSLLGVLLGLWIGAKMIPLYGEYYHFPELIYKFTYNQLLQAILLALVIAFSGTYLSLRSIFKLQPAEAMRPPAPPPFHNSFVEQRLWFKKLKIFSRMWIRGVLAHPRRSLLIGLGMSFTIVLLVSGLFWQDTMDQLLLSQYSFVQKETGHVQLTHPLAAKAEFEVQRLPGVLESEGYRYVPIKASYKNKTKTSSLTGLPTNFNLHGLVNQDLQDIPINPGSVFMSRILAQQLEFVEGDTVQIEVQEGKKQKLSLKIDKVADSFMSQEIFVLRPTLNRLLNSDDLINHIKFRSMSSSNELYKKIKNIPNVFSITYKDSALKMFSETSATFLLVFAFILSLFAGAIGFGIAYNNLRVTFAERDWEVATLRILGFKVSEVFKILIAEISFLVISFIPIGCLLGYLSAGYLLNKMTMENFTLPFVVDNKTYVFAIIIMIASTAISAWLLYGRIRDADYIAALKTRS